MGRNDQGCPGRARLVHLGRANRQPGRSRGHAELRGGGGSKASSRKMETLRPREGHGLLEVSYFRPRSRAANYEAEARPDELSSHWHLSP